MHRPAAVMAEDDDQRHIQDGDRVFNGTEDRRVDDVPGGADHEHVAEPLIEDDLRGDATVGTSEHHRGGALRHGQAGSVLDALAGVLGPPGNEPLVTLLECHPRLRRAGFRHGRYCALPPGWADQGTDHEHLGGRTSALVRQRPPRPSVAGDRGECLADPGQRVHVAADTGGAGGADLGGLGGPLADTFGDGAGRLRSGAAGVGQVGIPAPGQAPARVRDGDRRRTRRRGAR